MITTASSDVRANFRANVLQQALFAAYIAVWIWAAVDPVYPFDWLLENLLTFLAVPLLVSTYSRFPLSDASYVLIFLFACLHAVGSHYTYSEVPVGFWLQSELGLARNHYDRFVHFCFGLLLAYPLREAGLRYGGGARGFATLAALGFVFMGSASFEVVEMFVAMIVDPRAGQAYLGTQGDEWDAQKDMALAALGASLALALTVRLERRFDAYVASHRPKRPGGR
jgi:putative membrane protein